MDSRQISQLNTYRKISMLIKILVFFTIFAFVSIFVFKERLNIIDILAEDIVSYQNGKLPLIRNNFVTWIVFKPYLIVALDLLIVFSPFAIASVIDYYVFLRILEGQKKATSFIVKFLFANFVVISLTFNITGILYHAQYFTLGMKQYCRITLCFLVLFIYMIFTIRKDYVFTKRCRILYT